MDDQNWEWEDEQNKRQEYARPASLRVPVMGVVHPSGLWVVRIVSPGGVGGGVEEVRISRW